jgi:hypothetical protein
MSLVSAETAERFQGYVDAMDNLQDHIPPSSNDDKMAHSLGEKRAVFDPNCYFNILRHISMEEGYRLEWFLKIIQRYSEHPLIYARKTDEPVFRPDYTPMVFSKSYRRNHKPAPEPHPPNHLPFPQGIDPEKLSYSYLLDDMYYCEMYLDNWADSGIYWKYLQHINCEDSPDGYFQFVLMPIMATRFYRVWHALYDDFRVICTCSALEKVVSKIRNFKSEFTNRQAIIGDDQIGLKVPPADYKTMIAEMALKIDPTPVLTTKKDLGVMEITGFTNWGGFQKWKYKLIDGRPEGCGFDTIVEYDCGIQF